MERKKQLVEDNIMRGFSTNSPMTPTGPVSPTNVTAHTPPADWDRPEFEALTPPGYPKAQVTEAVPAMDLNAEHGNGNGVGQTKAPGADLLSSLSGPAMYNGGGYPQPSSAKKRKLAAEEGDFGGGDALEGLDADVAEMLRDV